VVEKTVAFNIAENVRNEIGKVIVGMSEAVESSLIALFTGGHIILEGVPGLAKTLFAKSFAMALGLNFKRIQFTSDILPSDIIGGLVFNRKTSELEFRPGPIFANIVLIDEINRAPPRSQSALLEAMQERQVTVEGVTHRLPEPFLVIATQNPIELEGTFPLPEAEIDRFMMRVIISYPAPAEEAKILEKKNLLGEQIPVNPVVDAKSIMAAVQEIRDVVVIPEILQYVVEIVSQTRRDSRLAVGASTRAEVALLYAAKAVAVLRGRKYVIPRRCKTRMLPCPEPPSHAQTRVQSPFKNTGIRLRQAGYRRIS
jgi:MoxR-like ATPase